MVIWLEYDVSNSQTTNDKQFIISLCMIHMMKYDIDHLRDKKHSFLFIVGKYRMIRVY